MSAVVGTIAQCRFLNRLLESGDTTLLTTNNIDKSFFSEYGDVYDFIKNHIDKYGKVPDKITLADRFPSFDWIVCNEPDEYIVDSLYSDKNTRELALGFNKVKDLIQGKDTENARKLVLQLAEKLSTSNHISYTDITEDTSRYDDYVKKCTDLSGYYVTTGFPELDACIGGWDRKEENAVIVARTNMGKTWLLLKGVEAASAKGLRVGLYSGEMSKNKVGYRIDTLNSHLSNYGMTHGDISINNDYKDYIKSIKSKLKGPIFVTTPNDSGDFIGANYLEGFIQSAKLDILFIDQYSLLADDSHARDITTQMSNIANALKKIQVKTQIPIIAVSQQNRASTENGVGNDMISLSDRIGQNATTIIFLEQKDGLATMWLTKARDANNAKKLKYAWDINKGIFNYIPEENDANNGVDCESLKNEYDYDEESTEEFT